MKPILWGATYGFVGHNCKKIIISLQQLTCGRSLSKSPETLNFHKLSLPVATLRQWVILKIGMSDRYHIIRVMSMDLFTAGIFFKWVVNVKVLDSMLINVFPW